MFKNKLIFIIIFLICFFILLPSFFLPWSLIDDGVSVLNAQKILDGLKTLNFNLVSSVLWESEVGRFRPVYWLYNFLTYILGGKNPFIYHLLRYLNLALAASLVFAIARKISGSMRAGLLSFLFFTISFLTFENWYRLGPQEPLATLFLGLAFYLILTKKTTFAFWPLLFLFFLKETNVVVLIAIVFLMVLNRRAGILKPTDLKKLLMQTDLLALITVGLVFLVKSGGSYSGYYQFGIRTWVNNLFLYLSYMRTYLGYLPLIALLSFLVFKKGKEEFFWLANILIMSFVFLAALLPWSFPLGRYLLPTMFFLAIFLGVELDKILRVLKDYPWVRLVIVFYFAGILIQNVVIMAGTFYDYFEREKINSELISYLASSVPDGGTVYLNLISGDSTIEYYEEAKMHLNQFYRRSDIKLSYLKDTNQLKAGDLIVEGYLKPNLTTLPKNILLVKPFEKNFKTLIVTTPVGFLKRMARWGINIAKGNTKVPDGIYTFYEGYYYWKVLKVS